MPAAGKVPDRVRVTYEDGTIAELPVRSALRGVRLPGIETPGYHVIELGAERMTVAIAPPRCYTIADITPEERPWGLAVQAYGLRSAGDCGIGDTAGVIALAGKAAGLRADAVALSPVHALFAADPNHFSPYSPSSRLFYNPLHADARTLFGDARVAKAAHDAGVAAAAAELEQQRLIDWRESARAKMAVFRRLFEDFSSTDLAARLGNAAGNGLCAISRGRGSAACRSCALRGAARSADLPPMGRPGIGAIGPNRGATRQARK